MKHPFKTGMTADRVVAIARKRKMFRVAKNEIVGLESTRLVIKWHFEACSLLIKFDFQRSPYRVFEILEPLQTGKRLTVKQATPTPAEVKRRVEKLKRETNQKRR
jgi:hypothetical protein